MTNQATEAPSLGTMSHRRLVLASGSQPRMRLLQGAGFAPDVIPSDVEEDGVDDLPPEKAAVTLAERKATAVAERLDGGAAPTVVIGCDTVLLMRGVPHGKPESLDQAREWCRRQRDTTVSVITGHCVVDLASDRRATGASRTDVRIGRISDEEIEAYLATGEAMNAAGALTIDGYGAPFIAELAGDHGTVIGISLPVVRDLLAELGIPVTSLWRQR